MNPATAAKPTPTRAPIVMPAPAPADKPLEDLAVMVGGGVEVGFEDEAEVGEEAEVGDEDVELSVTLKPRLDSVWSMKPGGFPVEVWLPLTSVMWNMRFNVEPGLFFMRSSEMPSLVPTVHV
jgi:hypothetical protein